MSQPLITIIIDNYNYARFLPDAIESALTQTYQSTEVIVVDDGSSDDSRNVISRYGGRIVPVFKENGGMASAYNAGLAHAAGEIVVILDSDDVLLPDALNNAVPLFTDPDVVKVHWPLYEIDGQGARTCRLVPSEALPDGCVRDALIAGGPHACPSSPTSGNAWRRSFLESVFPVPEAEFRQAADSYLFTLAPVYGRVRALQEAQALYRIHGGNDYAHKPAVEKNRLHLRVYRERCAALSKALAEHGVEAPASSWLDGNEHYEWMRAFAEATDELERITSPGDAFILIDEGHWDHGAGCEIIPGRRVIPFLERDGQYWGRPADAATAITELERMLGFGARYLVIAWSAFWWLDYYTGFAQCLRSRFTAILENDRLLVFDLLMGPSLT